MAKSMKLHSCYSYFRNMSHSRPFQTQNNAEATFKIAGKYSHSDSLSHSCSGISVRNTVLTWPMTLESPQPRQLCQPQPGIL